LTAQGHPRAIFERAIENENLVIAEATARELGRMTLVESLALTALAMQKVPQRGRRYAVRWLRPLLEEADSLTIEEVAFAAAALAALGGPSHAEATSTLSAVAQSPAPPVEKAR
jgi:hypothetical protein